MKHSRQSSPAGASRCDQVHLFVPGLGRLPGRLASSTPQWRCCQPICSTDHQWLHGIPALSLHPYASSASPCGCQRPFAEPGKLHSEMHQQAARPIWPSQTLPKCFGRQALILQEPLILQVQHALQERQEASLHFPSAGPVP